MTKSKTGVQEWAKHSFNFQKGCLNGCKYCYARRMLKRFEPEVDFDKPVLSVTETAKRLLKKKVGGVIMFPTMHDITAATKWIYAQFLCDLLMLDDKVLVVTKANKEMYDVIDFLITRCPEKFDNLELRVTIGSTDNERLKYFEPGAPSCYERVSLLRYAKMNGIKVSISCEPMLDDTVKDLIWTAMELDCDIWFGLANGYYEESMPKITDRFVQQIIRLSLTNENIKLKDSLTGKRSRKA